MLKDNNTNLREQKYTYGDNRFEQIQRIFKRIETKKLYMNEVCYDASFIKHLI